MLAYLQELLYPETRWKPMRLGQYPLLGVFLILPPWQKFYLQDFGGRIILSIIITFVLCHNLLTISILWGL
jgi:hypothetical protein